MIYIRHMIELEEPVFTIEKFLAYLLIGDQITQKINVPFLSLNKKTHQFVLEHVEALSKAWWAC